MGGEDGFSFFDAEAEELLGDVEHAADDTVDREVGAEGFFVEIVVGFALFLGPVAGFPRFEQAGLGSGGVALEGAQGVHLFDEFALYFFEDGFAELEGGLAGGRHAAFGDVVGKVGLSHELGEFMAQVENLADEFAVVVVAFAADGGVGAPDFFA